MDIIYTQNLTNQKSLTLLGNKLVIAGPLVHWSNIMPECWAINYLIINELLILANFSEFVISAKLISTR